MNKKPTEEEIQKMIDSFVTRDALYTWEHMKEYIEDAAGRFGLEESPRAVEYAEKAHEGQLRKHSNVPYIYHPLNMACHALSLNIIDDAVISACLLHDVVEDCDITVEDLPFKEETRELVRVLTREKDDNKTREELLERYYRAIAANPKATLIKCIDRCNNLTTMSWGLTKGRIIRTINETDAYYPQLIKVLRSVPEYNNASWLLQYQIGSMIDIYKRLL